MIVVNGGPTATLSGTTLAARPELAGVVVKDVMRPFAINLLGGGKITGKLQDRIVREKGGTLDFSYRIFNDASSTGTGPFGGTNIPNIDAVIRRHFPVGVSTDVDWRIDGLGEIAPATAARGGMTAVGFVFTTTIAPGHESRFFFVKTNATTYDAKGNVNISGGADVGDLTIIATFQPTKSRKRSRPPGEKAAQPAKHRRPRPAPAPRARRTGDRNTRARRATRRTRRP